MNNTGIISRFPSLLSLLICLILSAATLSVYLQVLEFEFINLDDDRYIYENRHMEKGLTFEGIAWSFSFADKKQNQTYWHPLTWLSHSLDCQLYGLNAGMHHLTSLIIHILNSILLFLLFERMTGEVWKSAIVAVLFALHPINVDSVAWVTERKNVLSTFFWMLTMLAYTVYSERPGLLRYLLTCLFFALGLLSKPMLVTLPCVLLLMDYWPLRRIPQLKISSISKRIIEKMPLFVLSGLSVYLSTVSLRGLAPIISTELRSMPLRIANALVSYIIYGGKVLWPQNLAIHYPYPSAIPLWKATGAGALLTLVSLLVLRALKRKPYLSVGWLWFIGTLVPVIGLVQAGLWPAMADRWAYIPMIGLLIMITWGVPEILGNWQFKTKFFVALCLAVILVLLPITWIQIRHYENSISLFEHALCVTENNDIAHSNLGFALANQGRTEEADIHYRKALKLNPEDPYGHNNLGISLAKKNRINEAIKHFKKALLIYPRFSSAHNNLGQALALENKTDEAIKHFKRALLIDPEFLEAHYNLGSAFLKLGKKEEAISHFSYALRINPSIGEIHRALGEALLAQERIGDATEYIKSAIKIDPNNADAYQNLGDIMRYQGELRAAVNYYKIALKLKPNIKNTSLGMSDAFFEMGNKMLSKGKIDEAISYIQESLRINNNAEAHTHLGYALLIQGKEDEAIRHFQEAIRIAPEKSVNAYYNMACVCAKKNKIEESIDWLKQAIDKGFNDWNILKTDKDLENIRNTAYYVEITDRTDSAAKAPH